MSKRLLLVDDEEPLRKALKRNISAGIDGWPKLDLVKICESAAEACEMMRDFDIIISDIEMADGDGFLVAAQAAKDGKTYLLHSSSREKVQQALRQGYAAVLKDDEFKATKEWLRNKLNEEQ